MNDEVVLSVIIPTHNRHEDLFALMRSIEGQTLSVEKFELLVVSNRVDLTLGQRIREAKEFGYKIRYFEVGKTGVNLARNLGLEKSQGKIVYFLDDDCILDDSETFERVLELHRQKPNYAGIGGAYHIRASAGLCDVVYQWIQDTWLESGLLEPPSTIYLIGGNASYKKDLLGEELQFDGSIVYGGSETELNIRLKQKGYLLSFSRQLKVLHCAHTSLRSLLVKGYMQGRSAYIRNLRGLKIPLSRPVYSHEVIAWQIIPNLSGWQRLRVYFILSFFDYFFQIGVRDEEKDVEGALTRGRVTLLFIRAPFASWAWPLVRAWVLERIHLIRNRELS